MPHFFYTFVEKVLHQDLKFRKVLMFAMERLLFAPIFQGVSLYTLARFEGKNHEDAVENWMKLYIPIIVANWKYLSLFTLINFTVVPPMVNSDISILSDRIKHSLTIAVPRPVRQRGWILLDRVHC